MLADRSSPSEEAEQHERIEAVGQYVAALPEELGRIIRLRYVEGRTTRAIAAATDIPEATVRLRLSEAHELLRQCLKARGLLE